MSQVEPIGEPISTMEPMLPRLFRVRDAWRETADVATLLIEPADASAPQPFEAGQFNMLYAFGIGEAPISIAGESAGALLHTVRDVGPVTRAITASKRGATIGVRGPFGSGWPLTEAEGRDLLLIAGGIGLAPLWEALQRVLRQRDKYRHISLLYGARTPGDLLYRHELERLSRTNNLHLAITVDRADSEWRGEVGVVIPLIARAPFDPANAVAMMCGPEVMMRFTVRDLLHRGIPGTRIFLSLERNMKCAIGFCGHCQFGPEFICKDGPVFPHERVGAWLNIQEI